MKASIRDLNTRNDTFQLLEVLGRNRYKRHQQGLFMVEGVKPINLLVKYGWEVDAFVVHKNKALSHWAQELLHNTPARIIYRLGQEMMSELSQKEETSELLLVAKMKKQSLDDLALKQDLLVVVLDRPQSPGNIGTIIRSCASLGVDALVMTGHCADLYDPSTLRASVGTIFTLPIFALPSGAGLASLYARLEEASIDYQVVGTSARAERFCDAVDFLPATILLLGNETDGLSKAYMNSSTILCKIPMGGEASSLNVGCAASIMLYEIAKQRRRG